MIVNFKVDFGVHFFINDDFSSGEVNSVILAALVIEN